jgi:hypothetical protein
MRSLGGGEKHITATMIHLCKADARMGLCGMVEVENVMEAEAEDEGQG